MFENNDFDLSDDDFLKLDKESPIFSPPLKKPCTFATPKPPQQVSCNFKSPAKTVQRKFPGPAGILQLKSPSKASLLNLSTEKLEEPLQAEEVCSQRSAQNYLTGPWQEMSRDFVDFSLNNKFNINWTKLQACLNKWENRKAPFLAASIETLEIFDGKVPTVNVGLKDSSGEIQATILHNLYEEYSKQLVVGSVVVIKQFSVLTTGNQNKHYITITQNNLLRIYCRESDLKSTKTIIIRDVKLPELLQEVKKEEQTLTTTKSIINQLKSNNINLQKGLINPAIRLVKPNPTSSSLFQSKINQTLTTKRTSPKKFNFKHQSIPKLSKSIFETENLNEVFNVNFDEEITKENCPKPTPSCSKLEESEESEKLKVIVESAFDGLDDTAFLDDF